MRLATSPSEGWLIKAAEWNPELSTKYRTNRSIGRPRKRWEDDINEFLKQIADETENLTESSNHINKNGSTQQKTAEDGLHSRKITQQIQLRERDENKEKIERAKMVCFSFLKAAAAPHPAPHALPNEALAVSSRATVKNIFDGQSIKNNETG